MSLSADVLQLHRRQNLMACYGEGYKDLVGSVTSSMHGNFLSGNREALYLALCTKVRIENHLGVKQ